MDEKVKTSIKVTREAFDMHNPRIAKSIARPDAE